MKDGRKHAQIIFTPTIGIDAEQIARLYDISLEKADQILSRPDTKELLQKALQAALHEALNKVVYELVRIPHEVVPVRTDCVVALPSASTKASGI
jgi:hypothetical protein